MLSLLFNNTYRFLYIVVAKTSCVKNTEKHSKKEKTISMTSLVSRIRPHRVLFHSKMGRMGRVIIRRYSQVSVRADLGKQDLVNIVSQKCQLTKETSKIVVDSMFDSIMAAVSNGDKVSVTGFGSFERTVRSARQGRNPATGEAMFIPETASVSFKASQGFKTAVKGRYQEQKMQSTTDIEE